MLSPANRDDRLALMRSMRAMGATLEDIGEEFGISRERVRQILAEAGDAPSRRGVDPVRLVEALRDPEVQSLHGLRVSAGMVGTSATLIWRTLDALELRPAAERLFRWRRMAARRRRCAELIAPLRAFFDQHGRSPYAVELGVAGSAKKDPTLPWASDLARAFGSVPAAFDAAGIPCRLIGSAGHRQHSEVA